MKAGDTNSLVLVLATSAQNAELGAVSLGELVVNQRDAVLVAEVVQPEGKAGGVTPSKFSERPGSATVRLTVAVPRLVVPSLAR